MVDSGIGTFELNGRQHVIRVGTREAYTICKTLGISVTVLLKEVAALNVGLIYDALLAIRQATRPRATMEDLWQEYPEGSILLVRDALLEALISFLPNRNDEDDETGAEGNASLP